MASIGNTSLNEGIPKLKDAFVVIIKTEWNAEITNELEAGAIRVLDNAGIKHKTFVVPGAVEITFAINAFHKVNRPATSAFIALGAVVRGDTPHFDYVCRSVTDGVTMLNCKLDVPVIFGVLTVNSVEQAKARLGGTHGHKGEEAGLTAIKMIHFNRLINH